MSTLVNRRIVVLDDNRNEVIGICTKQSYGGAGWMRVLLDDGSEYLALPEDFVRVVDTPSQLPVR